MTMSMLGASSDEYAAFQLGQQSAELDAATSRAIRSVFSRRAPQVDSVALLAQSHALAAENAQLKDQLAKARLQLADIEHDYAELDAWADIAAKKLKQHGL